jgi:hypothetical protein
MVNPGWQNFYVIVGTSAAALIGIQFIVITLVAGMRTVLTPESVAAFGTPSVVHLTVSLILSALMTVPWPSIGPVSIAVAVCGIGGVVYTGIVMRRARRQTVYAPVFEDWLWHGLLPIASYGALAVSALLLRPTPSAASFAIAATTLGLLLVGIHNAWDTVTHMLVTAPEGSQHGDRKPKRH